MYQKGDVVIYGCEGPCVVDSIGPVAITASFAGKDYYTLHPYFAPAGTIYAPVDAGDRKMRPVITREEALSLIHGLEDIDEIDVPDERNRENIYKQEIYKRDVLNCEGLVSLIKAVHVRSRAREACGKKITAMDDKYSKIAREKLLAELAVALDMLPSEAEDYILEQTGQAKR